MNEQIFNLFQENKHLDEIVTNIKINSLQGDLASYNPCHSISFTLDDLRLKHKIERYIEETTLTFSSAIASPQTGLDLSRFKEFELVLSNSIGADIRV